MRGSISGRAHRAGDDGRQGYTAVHRGIGEGWDAAGHAYAGEHSRHFDALHTVESWFTAVFMEPGPEADARRAKALPPIAMDQTRVHDAFFAALTTRRG